MIVLLFLMCADWEQSVYKVKLEPFDLVEDEAGASFLTGVHQLESGGELLYIRDKRASHILAVNRDGQVVRVIGRKGGGPGEFKGRVTAFAVHGPALWAIGDRGQRATYFEGGAHVLDFKLKGYNIDAVGPDARPFGFTNEYVLVQAHPSTRHLAALYGYDGELRRYVGDIAPIDVEALRKNPALNDTFWRTDGKRWFCLFKYRPFLLVFDRAFNQLAEFELTGPEIERRNEAFAEFKPKRKTNMPNYFFTDFKIHRGKLYALCSPALYQIDPDTGETLNRTYFFGEGEDFGAVEGSPLAMFHMAFLDDDSLVLGHPILPWNHDMWKVRLPYLEKR